MKTRIHLQSFEALSFTVLPVKSETIKVVPANCPGFDDFWPVIPNPHQPWRIPIWQLAPPPEWRPVRTASSSRLNP